MLFFFSSIKGNRLVRFEILCSPKRRFLGSTGALLTPGVTGLKRAPYTNRVTTPGRPMSTGLVRAVRIRDLGPENYSLGEHKAPLGWTEVDLYSSSSAYNAAYQKEMKKQIATKTSGSAYSLQLTKKKYKKKLKKLAAIRILPKSNEKTNRHQNQRLRI